MKKIIRYMQDQALNQSNSAIYLSPGGKEPQQRHSPTSSQHNAQRYSKQHSSALRRSTTPSSAAHSFPTHVSGSRPNPIPRCIIKHQFASDNILQSYEVYVPENTPTHSPIGSPEISGHAPSPAQEKIWIIYIHGGYFRDPLVTSSSFHPALSILATSPIYARIRSRIAGYASINYRLAPHERHPQDIEKTPRYELRDAKWPDMLEDVKAAIRHIQFKYGTGSSGFRYVLAGHSVGATLALLSTLTRDPALPKPLAVLGLCGIYDFPALHEVFPDYEPITRNAIKDAEDVKEASPALHSKDDYLRKWAKGEEQKVVVLAHSRTDGLVDWSQVERMQTVFDQDGVDENNLISCETMTIKGKHNETWEKGEEVAKAIALTVTKTMKARDAQAGLNLGSPEHSADAGGDVQLDVGEAVRSLSGATLVHKGRGH